MAIDDIKVLGLALPYFIAIIVGGVLLLVVVVAVAICLRKRRRLGKQISNGDRGEYAKIELSDSKIRSLSMAPSITVHNAINPDVENQAGLDRPTRFSTASTLTTAGRRDGSPNKLRKQRDRYEPRRGSQSPSKHSNGSLYDDPNQLLSMPYGALSMQKLDYSTDSRRTSASGSVLVATPMTEVDDPVNALDISHTDIELPPGIPRKSSRRNSSPNQIRALAAHEVNGPQLENVSRLDHQSLQGPVIPDRRSSSQPRQLPYPTVTVQQPGRSARARSISPPHTPHQDSVNDTFELDAAGTPARLVRRSSSRYSTPGDYNIWRAATPDLPRKSSRRISGNPGEREQALPEVLEMPELPRKSSRRDSQRVDNGALLDRNQLYLE